MYSYTMYLLVILSDYIALYCTQYITLHCTVHNTLHCTVLYTIHYKCENKYAYSDVSSCQCLLTATLTQNKRVFSTLK